MKSAIVTAKNSENFKKIVLNWQNSILSLEIKYFKSQDQSTLNSQKIAQQVRRPRQQRAFFFYLYENCLQISELSYMSYFFIQILRPSPTLKTDGIGLSFFSNVSQNLRRISQGSNRYCILHKPQNARVYFFLDNISIPLPKTLRIAPNCKSTFSCYDNQSLLVIRNWDSNTADNFFSHMKTEQKYFGLSWDYASSHCNYSQDRCNQGTDFYEGQSFLDINVGEFVPQMIDFSFNFVIFGNLLACCRLCLICFD